MSLTSYQTAPPRALESLNYGRLQTQRNDEFHRPSSPDKVLAGSAFRGKVYARSGGIIQRSSVVERSAVNRLVVGSNPTAGANLGTKFCGGGIRKARLR